MLVSIIIPTYNRKEFLKEAVDSVFLQTFQDFEIIVVDDGSSPDQRLKTRNQRLSHYYISHKGVAAARNFGVSVSKGKHIAFLDSDDLWDKRKLKKQLAFLKSCNEEAKPSVSGCGFKICYTNEEWIRNGKHLNQMKKHQKYHGWIFDKCLPLCIISCSSIIMERQVFDELGGFDETLPACEDYDLWLRLSLQYPIAYLNEKLIVKRGGHLDQLSRKYWGMDRFRIRALEKLLKQDLGNLKRKLVLQELAQKYDVLISGSWKRRKYWRWLRYKLSKRKCIK